MAQQGYYSCACCGRTYKDDGSEVELWRKDHTSRPGLQDDRPSDRVRAVQDHRDSPNP